MSESPYIWGFWLQQIVLLRAGAEHTKSPESRKDEKLTKELQDPPHLGLGAENANRNFSGI